MSSNKIEENKYGHNVDLLIILDLLCVSILLEVGVERKKNLKLGTSFLWGYLSSISLKNLKPYKFLNVSSQIDLD